MGGTELLTQRIARHLTQHGIAVQVVCIEDVTRGETSSLTVRDEMDGSVRVRRLDVQLAPHEDVRLWFDEPRLRSQLDTLCDTWQPDIVHLISGYLLGKTPLDAARARNIPTVVTLTDFWFFCPTIQLLKTDGSLCQGPEPLECAHCLASQRRMFRVLDERAPGLARSFWKTAQNHAWLGGRLGLPARLELLEQRPIRLMAALNQADALLPVTNFVVSMHRKNGFDADIPIQQINAFDVGDFDAITPRTETRAEIHFGFIGQIMPIKGVDLLVRAFLLVRQNNPAKKIYLHVYGKLNAEAAYANELQELARNVPEIIFHGAYEHRRTLALLNEMDVVVVPSQWYENVPRVILEAFAAKRPVIGTRVGGVTEVVTDEVNGLVFERGDVNDLARVMQRVIDDPQLLARLAQNIPPSRPLEQDMTTLLDVYTRLHTRRAELAAQ